MSLNPKNLKEENKMLHSPATWVPTLYFAMGMPFVVLNMVCTLMYKGMGVSDGQIAFWTSLIMLPWTLKPLWSPFLEIYKTKKFFVVLTQLLTGVLFALVAFALHLPFFFPVTIAILAVIAMSGATHDIAADGTYMSVLFNDEQQVKTLIEQLADVSPEIKQAIKTIELAPTSVTSDLLKITMYDTDEILVPLSELGKKLPYYSKIKPQIRH